MRVRHPVTMRFDDTIIDDRAVVTRFAKLVEELETVGSDTCSADVLARFIVGGSGRLDSLYLINRSWLKDDHPWVLQRGGSCFTVTRKAAREIVSWLPYNPRRYLNQYLSSDE